MKRTITLPHYDNDGMSLNHENILDTILEVVGGYSTTEICGKWKDEDGTVYSDTSIEVSMVYESQVLDSHLCSLLPIWCEELRQECLLTSVSTVEVAFVTPRVVAAA